MNFQQILMAAATQAGGAAASDPYGPELIVNGDMSSDTGWDLYPGAVGIAAGTMGVNAIGAGEDVYASQFPTLEVAIYHLVYTITAMSAGSATPLVGDTLGTTRTAPGTYTEDISSGGGGDNFTLNFVDGTVATIDNASLKQVL